jgi:stage V sporulation protein B
MTKTIYNMPCAFITPITVSIIPAITEHLTRKDYKLAKSTGDSAVRVTGLICMPCAVGLFVLAKPVTALLGGYRGENLELAAILMGMLGICVIFNAMVLLTNAIMQASGHENLPVINTFIGGILRLIAVYFLTGNPNINIVGTTIGSLLCYITIMVLNLITMARVVPNPPAVMRNLLRPLLAAIVMGVCTYGAWQALAYLLGEDASSVILCGGPILVGVAVYAVAAIALKAITREDCLLLPKGEKIARLLHL